MKRFMVAAMLFAGVAALGLATDDNDKALKELQGEYTVKLLSKGGQPVPDEVLKTVTDVKIKDDMFSLKLGEKDVAAKIKLDVSKKPAHIDVTPTVGADKDKLHPGLYKFEKGELTFVISHDDQRPTELEDKTETQMKLVMTKKEK